MKCAKCPGALEHLRQDDLELDRCPACRGFFFDPGELTKVFSDGNPETLREELCALPVVADAVPAVCPRSGHLMNRVRSTRVPQVSYDVCLHCNGIWLDAGELSALDEEQTSRQAPQRTTGEQIRELAHRVRRYFEEESARIQRTRDERLGRLLRLRERGLLPPREFARIRKEIERQAREARRAALHSGMLADADRLREEGFLSGADYRRMRKKILSKNG
jgi:Zn-finger nucleic acid-binding protein